MSDLRTTYRQLQHAPGHVATVILSLAVGMAVCGAAFSAVQTLLFRDLPGVVDRAGMVRIRWASEGGQFTTAEFDRLEVRASPHVDGLAAQGNRVVPVALPTDVVSARAAFVSGGFFAALGTTPVLGRLLTAADDRPGVAPVVVLGESLWQRGFAGDPAVVGSAIVVGGRSMRVVGIVPRGFGGLLLDVGAGPEDVPEVWLPLDRRAPHAAWLSVAVRPRLGIGASETQALVSVLAGELEQRSPPMHHPAALQVFPAGLDWKHGPWTALQVVVVFLLGPLAMLAVGCANVVNLQLARATERTRELSVRLTLGASRLRLLRLLVLEVGMLGLAAAGLGALGAAFLLGRAEAVARVPLPLDPSVAVFLGVLVVGVVAIAGLAPGWIASRDVVAAGLRIVPGALALTRLRDALVAFQVAVSVVLLFMTALGLATLRANDARLPPEPERIVVAELDLSAIRPYTPATPRRAIDVVIQSLTASDAVEGAAAATFFRHGAPMRYRLASDAAGIARAATAGHVTPGWFRTTGTRLLVGREAADGERSGAVVSAAFAAALGGPAAVLGRELQLAQGAIAIVGVAEDSSAAAPPLIYLPLGVDVPSVVVVTVRARTEAAARQALSTALRAASPAIPRDRVATLDRKTADAARGFEAFIDLAAGIAGSTLVLAAAGVCALLSFAVRRRRREVGIRVAVGATPLTVMAMVLRHAVWLAAIGALCGLVAGAGLAYVMRATLFGVSTVAPLAMLPTIGLLLAATAVASAVPAWQALRIDPITVLREE